MATEFTLCPEPNTAQPESLVPQFAAQTSKTGWGRKTFTHAGLQNRDRSKARKMERAFLFELKRRR